jgi:Fimbrial assembly protein (PilN)
MSQQVNLYNPALLPEADAFSGRMALLALAGICVLALLFNAWAAWNAARLSDEVKQYEARLTGLQGEITRLSQEVATRKPTPQLAAELDSLNGLLAGRNEVIAVLKSGALGDTRGVSEYFRAFARQTVDGLWLTSFTVVGAGNDITIEGRTLSAELVPGYIRKLRREDVLRGHGFGTLDVHKPAEKPLAPDARKTAEFLEFRMASQGPVVSLAAGGSAR